MKNVGTVGLLVAPIVVWHYYERLTMCCDWVVFSTTTRLPPYYDELLQSKLGHESDFVEKFEVDEVFDSLCHRYTGKSGAELITGLKRKNVDFFNITHQNLAATLSYKCVGECVPWSAEDMKCQATFHVSKRT